MRERRWWFGACYAPAEGLAALTAWLGPNEVSSCSGAHRDISTIRASKSTGLCSVRVGCDSRAVGSRSAVPFC
jgi:hypothetical protein